MNLHRRVALIGVGLTLTLLAATTSPLTGTAPGTDAGSRAGGDTAPSDAPRDGMVLAEDGSWVPLSFFQGSDLQGPGVQGPGRSGPSTPGRAVESKRVQGSFIVDLASGLDPHEVAPQIAADYGGDVEFVYDEVVGGFAFSGPDDVRERMADDPRIRGVDADYEAHLAGHTLPVERTAIRAPGAWSVSQGTGAVVAIIDTGVNASHPQLGGRVLGSDGSCVNESGSTAGNDTNGHGTAVAGHAFGHYGVLPDAKGYAVKIFPDGSGTTSYSRIICGLNLVKSWASSRGIHAANLSLSGTESSSSLQTAVRQLRDAGVVVVAAAGNSGGKVGYPAAYPEAVAVSALNQSNTALASFSSRGREVAIGAPGQSLTTLLLGSCCGTGSGTSFAAPQVAAAAAVVKARDPAMSVGAVETRMQSMGFCPPGTSPGLNLDGGNCDGTSRTGDTDGYTEPALNLEGTVKGPDALPTGSFVSPGEGQVIRDADFPTILVSATDDDTPSADLQVAIRVGQGEYQPAQFNTSSGTHDLPWPRDLPDGPVTIVAQITEPDNGSVTRTVNATVDNVDDPPTVTWQNPAPGANVGSPVLLRVSASDDRGVTSVTVYEDGEERTKLTPNGAYYEGSLELSEASHTLTVVAADVSQTSAPAQRTLTVTSLLYRQTFDTAGSWTGGWYESPSSSRWHTTAACASGAASPPFAYFGLSSSCLFSTSSSGYLYSPVLTGLPAAERLLLKFDSKERVESCSGCTRDRRYVQVNYGGKSWQTLYYKNAGTDPGSGQWEAREMPLNACTGRVQIRFLFNPTSSKNNNYFGWAIDNLTIGRSSEPSAC